MLTVHKVAGPRGAAYADYITAAEPVGDYYVGDDGDPCASLGFWLGDLVADLDLGDDVKRDDLLALMSGRDPRTGELLVRQASGTHVAAHDLTFSAPSSVTAVWAIAPEDVRASIQKAQELAVAAALSYIQQQVALVRRRDPTAAARRVENAEGRQPQPGELPQAPSPIVSERATALLAARFGHHTARQTLEQVAYGLPPDPQLHTHLLLLSIARRKDGRLVAVSSLPLFRRRSEVGAVYRATLAAELVRLGFDVERCTGNGGRYFEISGVPDGLRQRWSSRSHEIADQLADFRSDFRQEQGRAPTVAEERAWKVTQRQRKADWHEGSLFAYWRATATHFVRPGSRFRTGSGQFPADGRERLIEDLLGPNGLTHEHATFDGMSLRREAYQRAPGLIDATAVEDVITSLMARAEIVEVAEAVWTTREILRLERAVLAWRDVQRGTATAATGTSVLAALARCPVDLSNEQQNAVTALVAGDDGFVGLTGEAGVGKGVVLRVASDAWRGDGRQVVAVAVGGAQAQRLAADLGQDVQALTIDSFVHRVRSGRLRMRPGDVVTLDEAGQVDTRRWAALIDAVRQVSGAPIATAGGGPVRLVALGDEAQLPSIQAGGLWPLLSQGAPRLREVRRTAHIWERDAWAHVRRGEAMEALSLYAKVGHVDVSDTRRTALDRAVDEWDRDGRTGLLITDASNVERHRANTAAQLRRIARGELGDTALSATAPQGPVDLRAGDRVVFRAQYRHAVSDRRVENGTTGTIVAVDPAERWAWVRTDEAAPREVTVSVDQARLDLYYAAHVFTTQGATIPRAYVVAGGWQTNRESLYVALSRSRDGSKLYVDRETLGQEVNVDALAEMARRAAHSRGKVAAHGHRPRTPVALVVCLRNSAVF